MTIQTDEETRLEQKTHKTDLATVGIDLDYINKISILNVPIHFPSNLHFNY